MEQRIVEPRPDKVYDMLVFGDFSVARLKPPYKVETEKGKFKFYFIPTDEMRFKYQIQDTEFNLNTGMIEKEYDASKCMYVSDYPVTWIILQDYSGKDIDNDFIKRINLSSLETIKVLSRENSSLKVLLARQAHEHRTAMKFPQAAEISRLKLLEKHKELFSQSGIVPPDFAEHEENS